MSKLATHARTIRRDLLLNSIINSPAVPRMIRPRLWSAWGHSVHPSATVNPDGFLGASSGLTIGSGSFINYGCFFDLNAPTSIGRDCAVGYQVMFVTAGHEIGGSCRRAGKETAAAIEVGDGVWIGARVVVLAGVKIGNGCIIAAGSIVTRDCKPNRLYAGNPAVEKRLLQ